jgi:D-threo-aldose 1-dehydrogenase
VRSRIVPGTDIELTELGFGAASIGNLYRATTDEEAELAVEKAWELGIRYFDTAPHYGLGLSEYRLGRALRRYPRDEYVISTKVGRLVVDNDRPTIRDEEGFDVPGDKRRVWDFSDEGIRRSVTESLDRLGLDRVDILYAHDPDQSPGDSGDFAAETLISLREQGVVRAVGVGSNSAEEVAKTFQRHDIDVAMLAGRYTLLEQASEDTALRAAAERGKSIVAVGVFNSGILATSTPQDSAHYNYLPATQELLERVKEIAKVCAEFGVSVPGAAIAFPLQNETIANVSLGMRDAIQVQRNVSLYEQGTPDELWREMKASGLLPTMA